MIGTIQVNNPRGGDTSPPAAREDALQTPKLPGGSRGAAGDSGPSGCLRLGRSLALQPKDRITRSNFPMSRVAARPPPKPWRRPPCLRSL